MRIWLQTKMEEERRRAEEERTKQEQLRGDNKRLEFDMMREALNRGVPAPLVPFMFLNANLGAGTAEWLGEYLIREVGTFQQQQQPYTGRLPGSPTQGHVLRRETRSIQQMHPQASAGSAPPAMGPPTTNATTYVTYQPTTGPISHSGRRSPVQPQFPPQTAGQQRQSLPRINTNEMQPLPPNVTMQIPMGPPVAHGTAQPPPPPAASTPAHPPPQQPAEPAQPAQNIFFHHWQPPNTQSSSSGNQSSAAQTTVSPQRQQQLDSPFSHHPPPNALSRDGQDYTGSPKKRKNNAGQPQQPPPTTSQPFSPQRSGATSQSTSSILSSRTRRAHSRQRSDTAPSAGISRSFEHYPRATRQRRSLGSGDAPGESSVSSSAVIPPIIHQQFPPFTTRSRSGSTHYNVTTGDREHSAPPRPFSAGSSYKSHHVEAAHQPFPHHPPASASTAEHKS